MTEDRYGGNGYGKSLRSRMFETTMQLKYLLGNLETFKILLISAFFSYLFPPLSFAGGEFLLVLLRFLYELPTL